MSAHLLLSWPRWAPENKGTWQLRQTGLQQEQLVSWKLSQVRWKFKLKSVSAREVSEAIQVPCMHCVQLEEGRSGQATTAKLCRIWGWQGPSEEKCRLWIGVQNARARCHHSQLIRGDKPTVMSLSQVRRVRCHLSKTHAQAHETTETSFWRHPAIPVWKAECSDQSVDDEDVNGCWKAAWACPSSCICGEARNVSAEALWGKMEDGVDGIDVEGRVGDNIVVSRRSSGLVTTWPPRFLCFRSSWRRRFTTARVRNTFR